METEQQYRDKALECLSAADHARDPAERLSLIAIAKLFLGLAQHVVGKLDRSTPASLSRTTEPER
jgi:hypothetical protein